ncbi:hypothetical protein [Bradyrhizobium sp.]|uniref:hypothetical protein n=1 Tax=Bradyrhizobium sp. TaxID=376 RepID=UPI0040383795
MVQIDYEGRPDRPAVSPECAPLHRYLGTSFRGGPGALALDRQITALTGKNIDRLRGDYALGSAGDETQSNVARAVTSARATVHDVRKRVQRTPA